MKTSAWSSRSLGSRLQHEFFYAVIRLGGWRMAYFSLAFVVLAFSLMGKVVARQRPYLTRRFPSSRSFGLRLHALRQNWAFGSTLVDRAVKGILGQGTTKANDSDKALFATLLGRGHGLLVLTAHVGAWQWAMADLSFLERPITILYARDPGDMDRQYFEHGGATETVRFLDPRDGVGAAIEVIAALRRGEIVCAMADRVFGEVQGRTTAPFLGDSIALPLGPFSIASKTGSPLAFVFTPRTGAGQAVIQVPRIYEAPLGINPAEMACTFARCLDNFVRDHPYQFFNYFNLWGKQ